MEAIPQSLLEVGIVSLEIGLCFVCLWGTMLMVDKAKLESQQSCPTYPAKLMCFMAGKWTSRPFVD